MGNGSFQLALAACVLCAAVSADYRPDQHEDEYDGGGGEGAHKHSGFVTPLHFSPLFQGNSGHATPPSRTRRYTDGGGDSRLQRQASDEEEESPYDYRSDYSVRPKEFDSGPYSSSYTDSHKDRKKDDDYTYDYDSDYNNDDYERIKKLSEAQAAEIKENPENCQAVKKDSMTCMVCKNPKTGGNYESCSYVAEPKSNQYAYSREKKFDSKDAPEAADDKESKEEAKPVKLQKDESSREGGDSSEETEPKYKSTYRAPLQPYAKHTSEFKQPYQGYRKDPSDGTPSGKYKYSDHDPPRAGTAAYSEANEDDDDSDENSDSKQKPYNYKAAVPEFYTDNEPKKDVEHVLAEFKKKDRSACKKVQKNGMTCYQCIDANGLKHEECMFIQESAPKRSHLAYQELKEFTSRPATLEGDGAESQIITTATPLTQRSATYLATASKPYGSKLKRKKAQGAATTTTPIAAPVRSLPVKIPRATPAETKKQRARVARSSDKDGAEKDVVIADETGIAPPEEFAGEASKGAFWAETQPRYSPTLGVSLPEYMLSPSEHELSFDETVAGG